MAKLTNVRERVHQPFRDSLIRTSGYFQGTVQDRVDLFTQAGKSIGETNLPNGSTLPSDQSMVVLALRCFLWFRSSVARSAAALDSTVGENGDYFIVAGAGGANEAAAVALMAGTVPGNYNDVHRLYWQASEALIWSFGAGDKFSLTSMPSSYFPWGGGLSGDIGGATDLIHWDNGTPNHAGILRLARAILIPPRQNIKCTADIVRYPDGGNGAVPFGVNQGARNMLNLTDNLNTVDLINKCISFCFDGLFSRDVQ
jgi:hypothetical protein